MTKPISVQESEIPLYLIHEAVLRWILKKGDAVYRISIVRTHWHHYNISVRTKAIGRKILSILEGEDKEGEPEENRPATTKCRRSAG